MGSKSFLQEQYSRLMPGSTLSAASSSMLSATSSATLSAIVRAMLSLMLPLILSMALTSCSSTLQRPVSGPAGEVEVLTAQQNRARNVEVTLTAPVRKLLPDDTQGLQHQRFLLQLSNGSTILVAHNTGEAPAVPIEPGQMVTVHGEFIWNQKGGVIHWTHHSDNGRHEGGYIDYQGQRYQ